MEKVGVNGRERARPGDPGGHSNLQQRESGGKEAEGRQKLLGSGPPTGSGAGMSKPFRQRFSEAWPARWTKP